MKIEEIPEDMSENEAREIADMLIDEVSDINAQIEGAITKANAGGREVDHHWLGRAISAKRFKKAQARAYRRHQAKKKFENKDAVIAQHLRDIKRAKEQAAEAIERQRAHFEMKIDGMRRKRDRLLAASEENHACVQALKAFIRARWPEA